MRNFLEGIQRVGSTHLCTFYHSNCTYLTCKSYPYESRDCFYQRFNCIYQHMRTYMYDHVWYNLLYLDRPLMNLQTFMKVSGNTAVNGCTNGNSSAFHASSTPRTGSAGIGWPMLPPPHRSSSAHPALSAGLDHQLATMATLQNFINRIRGLNPTV